MRTKLMDGKDCVVVGETTRFKDLAIAHAGVDRIALGERARVLKSEIAKQEEKISAIEKFLDQYKAEGDAQSCLLKTHLTLKEAIVAGSVYADGFEAFEKIPYGKLNLAIDAVREILDKAMPSENTAVASRLSEDIAKMNAKVRDQFNELVLKQNKSPDFLFEFADNIYKLEVLKSYCKDPKSCANRLAEFHNKERMRKVDLRDVDALVSEKTSPDAVRNFAKNFCAFPQKFVSTVNETHTFVAKAQQAKQNSDEAIARSKGSMKNDPEWLCEKMLEAVEARTVAIEELRDIYFEIQECSEEAKIRNFARLEGSRLDEIAKFWKSIRYYNKDACVCLAKIYGEKGDTESALEAVDEALVVIDALGYPDHINYLRERTSLLMLREELSKDSPAAFSNLDEIRAASAVLRALEIHAHSPALSDPEAVQAHGKAMEKLKEKPNKSFPVPNNYLGNTAYPKEIVVFAYPGDN